MIICHLPGYIEEGMVHIDVVFSRSPGFASLPVFRMPPGLGSVVSNIVDHGTYLTGEWQGWGSQIPVQELWIYGPPSGSAGYIDVHSAVATYASHVSGQWYLRQQQLVGGAHGSWPLRQRQTGALSGSWPLRQRQRGV